ncbi:hypothetical protein ACVWVZ_004387 [Pseudomonas tolaasii]
MRVCENYATTQATNMFIPLEIMQLDQFDILNPGLLQES